MLLWIKASQIDEADGRFIETEGTVGAHLLALIKEGIALSRKLECGIQFNFNEHLVWLRGDDDPAERFFFFQRLWGWDKEA